MEFFVIVVCRWEKANTRALVPDADMSTRFLSLRLQSLSAHQPALSMKLRLN